MKKTKIILYLVAISLIFNGCSKKRSAKNIAKKYIKNHYSCIKDVSIEKVVCNKNGCFVSSTVKRYPFQANLDGSINMSQCDIRGSVQIYNSYIQLSPDNIVIMDKMTGNSRQEKSVIPHEKKYVNHLKEMEQLFYEAGRMMAKQK